MPKNAALKARGNAYDAALRFARATQALEDCRKLLEQAKGEYEEAGQAMRAARAQADAAEADAVAEEVKTDRKLVDAIDGPRAVAAPMELLP